MNEDIDRTEKSLVLEGMPQGIGFAFTAGDEHQQALVMIAEGAEAPIGDQPAMQTAKFVCGVLDGGPHIDADKADFVGVCPKIKKGGRAQTGHVGPFGFPLAR